MNENFLKRKKEEHRSLQPLLSLIPCRKGCKRLDISRYMYAAIRKPDAIKKVATGIDYHPFDLYHSSLAWSKKNHYRRRKAAMHEEFTV